MTELKLLTYEQTRRALLCLSEAQSWLEKAEEAGQDTMLAHMAGQLAGGTEELAIATKKCLNKMLAQNN